MSNLEIWLLAISLAMDCFSVSITSGIILRRVCMKVFLTIAFFFGLFQALMPSSDGSEPAASTTSSMSSTTG